MTAIDKLNEIEWRLDNRTAMYHAPGTPLDTVAHDDMEWLLSYARVAIRQIENEE